jgi:hypothetical protein
LSSKGEESAVSRIKESAEREAYSSGEEMYSSGEETTSTWTVENRKVFEEFRNVEIDVALHRKGILSSEEQQQGMIIAKTSSGARIVSLLNEELFRF